MLQRILKQQVGNDAEIALSRRLFCKQAMCGALLVAAATPAMAYAGKGKLPPHKWLAFEHTHTGEKLNLTYYEKGRYIKPALREINHLLRDFRTGDIYPIDVELLDQLHDIKLLLGSNRRPFHIISGYRSPLTNSYLHDETSGVAQNSLHMQGKAIDIRIEGVNSRHIRNAGLSLQKGGVGYYPESDFVHLDTGKFRFW